MARKSKYAELEHTFPEEFQLTTIMALDDAPRKGTGRPPGPMYLQALRARRNYLRERGISAPEGRPRTKFTKAEVEEDAMRRMLPKALQVLEEQLDANDPKVRQAAAVKVVEYVKGKPTQTIHAQMDNVNKIVYESAAYRPQEEIVDAEFTPLPELLPADGVA